MMPDHISLTWLTVVFILFVIATGVSFLVVIDQLERLLKRILRLEKKVDSRQDVGGNIN